MIKKIRRSFIGILALLMIVQASLFTAYATVEEMQSGRQVITFQRGMSTVPYSISDDIVNAAFRGAFFAVLYDASVLPSDISSATLKSFSVENLGEAYSISGSFYNGNWLFNSSFTINTIIGNKSFWRNVINSSSFINSTAIDIGTIILGVMASKYPGFVDPARSVILNSGSSIGDTIRLRSIYNKMSAEGELAVVLGFEVQNRICGILIPNERPNVCSFALSPDMFINYPLPEGVDLPNWVVNGPNFI